MRRLDSILAPDRPRRTAPSVRGLGLAIALATALLATSSLHVTALPAAAQVKVKVLEDGTPMIYNETSDQRARRTSGSLLPVPSVDLGALIDLHARRQGLSERLVQAVVQVESGYNRKALSKKGAMGLMQLMPATARELGVQDAYDAEQNVRGGTLYLRRLLDRYDGDLVFALAAYNAGPTAVDRYGGVPPYRETQNYVRKVLALYRGGGAPSRLLQEHLREQATKREEAERKKTTAQRRGEPVFLGRDERGRILITTSPKPN